MSELIFTNAQIVLPNEVVRGSLRAVDGLISDISTDARAHLSTRDKEQWIDCEGDFLIPGLIELHTDNLERHIEPRAGVAWPYTAAIIAHDAELASAGITTVFDAIRVGSFINSEISYSPYARELASEMLKLHAAGALKISHHLHLRAEICSATLTRELACFGPEDRVGLVSLMDHTPGQRQFRDLDLLRVYLSRKRSMSEADFETHCTHLLELRSRYGEQHERDAIAAAKRYGATLASHDDTTAEQVAVSAGYGIKLAEFPTTFEAAMACQQSGIAVMMGAPNLIRGRSHSGNVTAIELAQNDVLHIVSSDYVPSASAQSAFVLGEIWGSLARGVATITAAPARTVGLEDRGVLEVRKRADFVRVKQIPGAALVKGVWVRGRRVS